MTDPAYIKIFHPLSKGYNQVLKLYPTSWSRFSERLLAHHAEVHPAGENLTHREPSFSLTLQWHKWVCANSKGWSTEISSGLLRILPCGTSHLIQHPHTIENFKEKDRWSLGIIRPKFTVYRGSLICYLWKGKMGFHGSRLYELIFKDISRRRKQWAAIDAFHLTSFSLPLSQSLFHTRRHEFMRASTNEKCTRT